MIKYTVYDILQAECTLEPLTCLHCSSDEVIFDQYIGDAYCQDCDRWQLDSEI